MRAMVLEAPGRLLQLVKRETPAPGPGQILSKVRACGVCRTDLHVVDGELPKIRLPIVPGHEIVGVVAAVGAQVESFKPGQLVGVPWLGGTCGTCHYCQSGRENLCDHAIFTGYTRDGGYAEYTTADARFCFPLPENLNEAELAPLLCAGLIGWRSFKLSGEGKRIGLYGFGAAAHIITQIAVHQGREVYAFTRPGDTAGQDFARSLGAVWAGDSNQQPPYPLDAAIIYAPVGLLVPVALKATGRGGVVVCAGIHMSDIPSFSYELLWGERQVRSVANLTRADALEFLELAPEVPVKTTVKTYPLEAANDALADLRAGRLRGAAVLLPTA